MTTTIEHKFETRRDAELAVERLVQKHGFERTDVFISAEGDQNTVGEERGGGDAGTALEAGRDDPIRFRFPLTSMTMPSPPT